MLVHHKKSFYKGLLLIISFFTMAAIMLLPIFPGEGDTRLTSLEYADAVFNSLSKGSSNFIEEVKGTVQSMAGRRIDLGVTIDNHALAMLGVEELKDAGVQASYTMDGVVSFHGELEQILGAALRDSAELFNNNGAAVSKRYGIADPLDASRAWWHLLEPCIKILQKKDQLAEAKAVDAVVRKAIEPANNFYGISDTHVADNILLILAMLTFYVLYAIWYGFGIYNLFDGLGLMGAHSLKVDEQDD